LTIFGCLARTPAAIPYAVGLYITAAYWFTASTSFANPAVTIARALSDTFAGIAPAGVLAFIVAQLVGMAGAVTLARWLWRDNPQGSYKDLGAPEPGEFDRRIGGLRHALIVAGPPESTRAAPANFVLDGEAVAHWTSSPARYVRYDIA